MEFRQVFIWSLTILSESRGGSRAAATSKMERFVINAEELFSLKMYVGTAKTYNYSLFCFHVCTHVCFQLMSNVHIVRTFENRIQTFEKWHNVAYRYISYIKSETSHIWRTVTWFLKPLGEMENHIYLRKTLSTT